MRGFCGEAVFCPIRQLIDQRPAGTFPTITAARPWAEEHGTTADLCIITESPSGRAVL